jgi:hypothetical protein
MNPYRHVAVRRLTPILSVIAAGALGSFLFRPSVLVVDDGRAATALLSGAIGGWWPSGDRVKSVVILRGDRHALLTTLAIVSRERDWSADSRLLRALRRHAKVIYGIYVGSREFQEFQKGLITYAVGGLGASEASGGRAVLVLGADTTVFDAPTDRLGILRLRVASLGEGAMDGPGRTAVAVGLRRPTGAPGALSDPQAMRELIVHRRYRASERPDFDYDADVLACSMLALEARARGHRSDPQRSPVPQTRRSARALPEPASVVHFVDDVRFAVDPSWGMRTGATPTTSASFQLGQLGARELYAPELWFSAARYRVVHGSALSQLDLLRKCAQALEQQDPALDLWRCFPVQELSRRGCEGSTAAAVSVGRWLGIRVRPAFGINLATGSWHWWLELYDSKTKDWIPTDISDVGGSSNRPWWRRADLFAVFAVEECQERPSAFSSGLRCVNVTTNYFSSPSVTAYTFGPPANCAVGSLFAVCLDGSATGQPPGVGPFRRPFGTVVMWFRATTPGPWTVFGKRTALSPVLHTLAQPGEVPGGP